MLRLKDVTLALGSFKLSNISLHVEQGTYLVLLGPTGTGKTVLLETIAGMHRVDSGSIFIDGKEVTNLPPEKRRLGVVYQDYALFPHMRVHENIAFGLRLRKQPKDLIRQSITKIADFLEISSLLDRRPQRLSGGEKQRVALARALVLQPCVLLLDEPLSALDRYSRDRLRRELKRIHREIGVTIFHITHDLNEAFFLADKIAVMKNGRILQQGNPVQVLDRPHNRAVAELIGIKNFLEAAPRSSGLHTKLGRFELSPLPSLPEDTSKVVLTIPVWSIELLPERQDDIYAWKGKMKVTDLNVTDEQVEMELRHSSGQCIKTALSRRELAKMPNPVAIGDAVQIGIWKHGLSYII